MAQIFSIIFSYFAEYIIICLLAYRFVSPLPLLYIAAIGIVFSFFWTICCDWLYKKLNPPRQMLVIYGTSSTDELYDKLAQRDDKYIVAKELPHTIGEAKLKKAILGYEAVLLHDLSATLRNHLIKFCYENSIRVYVTPKLYDILIRGASDMDLFDTPFLLMRNSYITGLEAFIKRAGDIVISLAVLILLSPLMLLIALAVKLTDHGPVLYKQVRLTKDGKTFNILKFRSMMINAEKGQAQLMSKNDARITPIGKILRRSHLDELPQVFNILAGDMSVVGPRPERPEIAKIYEQSIPEFSYRLKVKAGLTGYAQVYGKYNSTPYDKLKLDLMYIQKFSILLDIRLLLLTGKTIFIPDHAEGVDDKYKTALRK